MFIHLLSYLNMFILKNLISIQFHSYRSFLIIQFCNNIQFENGKLFVLKLCMCIFCFVICLFTEQPPWGPIAVGLLRLNSMDSLITDNNQPPKTEEFLWKNLNYCLFHKTLPKSILQLHCTGSRQGFMKWAIIKLYLIITH